MTPEQEEHLESIKRKFSELVDIKYRAGQQEHGGDLIDNDALWFVERALEEAIDQVVYLISLRDKFGA